MTPGFHIVVSPSSAEVAEVANLQPGDFFVTPACAAGHAAQGLKPVLLGLRENGAWVCGCLGFLRIGRLTRAMDIPWLPALPPDSPFWTGLATACRALRVWDLSVRRITAAPESLPALGPVVRRCTGFEYRLQLGGGAVIRPTSENHCRNLAKAEKADLVLRQITDPGAVAVHLGLMQASMQRRAERGEHVPGRGRDGYFHAMLQAGAGHFFQAIKDGEVCSSVFVLRAAKGAYYQTAGTTPQGMADGASPFLIVNTARQLQAEGVTCFDLGGVEAGNEGLGRFKAGFGAERHSFAEAEFAMAHPVLRKVRTAIALLRRSPAALMRSLVAVDQSLAYCLEPAAAAEPSLGSLRVVKLTDEQLHVACPSGSEFSRQSERLSELGYNDAFGAYLGNQLVHVSWLISPDHDRQSPIRDVKLRDGEAEITHCQTAERHRGKNIYPQVVRHLCREAARRGARRLFMVTSPENTASQRGILKASLRPCGRIIRLRLPCLLGERAWRLRTFRWRTC
jgi:ribosomal protein S18 acetylase RimI-like enzyme